jgi:hypothetical protein
MKWKLKRVGTRTVELIKITVRGETSKVGNTRKFVVKDYGYFLGLVVLQARRVNDNS